MNSLDPPADQAGAETPDAAPPVPSSAPVSRYDATILEIASARGEEKSFCPSEVARALSEDWRPLLTHVPAAWPRQGKSISSATASRSNRRQ
jgi:hypothetical protein